MSGYSTVTAAKAIINALDWQESVLSRTTDVPGAPTNGDRYIIPDGATGVWTGYDDYIAEYRGSPLGSWQLIAPDLGTATFVEDELTIYLYFGAWFPFALFLFQHNTATLTAGDAFVDVTHGLFWVPTIDDIQVTPNDDLGGRSFWVSNVGAVTFRINMNPIDLVDHAFTWVAML